MQESPLFTKTYDLLLWIIPAVQKFPRQHRFGLAERIQDLVLDFQDAIVAAGKSKGSDRRDWLSKADIQLEQLRGWLRLSLDLRLLSVGQYEHGARMLVEVGRLLGAWIKQA